MQPTRQSLISWILLCFLLVHPKITYAEYTRTEQIHPSLPPVTIRVSDTGLRDETRERENRLLVTIQSEDESLAQELTYDSSENSRHEGAAALARLEDLNQDGYGDLLLLTAQGARNVFYAVSIFHPEESRFLPVMQGHAWNSERKALSETATQLELCNYELHDGLIVSSVADGYRYHTDISYAWEGYSLVPAGVADVYDAGEGMIGELLYTFGTGIRRCWDETYPESWYYGQEGVFDERREAWRSLTIGRAAVDPAWMRVANVDWVNLRRQDSKASPSLAKLDRGTEVQVLGKSRLEEGWIRVFVWPEKDEAGLTGYIWHSFLEKID